MTSGPHEFVAAAPRWRQPGMRVLLALAARPRGMALLRRLAPADQAAAGLLAMMRYDEPARARALGWDAASVAEGGRVLRRTEGRP